MVVDEDTRWLIRCSLPPHLCMEILETVIENQSVLLEQEPTLLDAVRQHVRCPQSRLGRES